MEKHRSGKGAKYTRSRGYLTVVYRELVGSKGDATRREMAIKKLARSEKKALIAAYAATAPKQTRHRKAA